MLIRDYLLNNARSWPERLAYVSDAGRRSWGELTDRSLRLAKVLQSLGAGQGDVVATMAEDGHEVIECWYAASLTGAVRTGVNYRYAPREVAHILDDAQVKVLIIEGGACERVFRSLDGPVPAHVIGVGAHGFDLDYETLLRDARPDPVLPPLRAGECAAISYTTGSTGLPKGVRWSHGGVAAAQVNTWLQAGMRHDDVFLHCLPAAGVPILIATWNVVNGATVVLERRFSAPDALRLLERERVTAVLWVPTMMNDVLSAPDFAAHDLSRLRLVIYGSMPASPALIRRAIDAFGCRLQQWYGATEATAGWTNILHHEDHLKALDDEPELLTSCGRSTLHCDVAVLDDAGSPVPVGEIGEICVRGRTLMLGYQNLPEETAAVLRGGWLRMGDLGRRDDRGFFYLVDRKKFMIVTGGYNVYPVVVENVLADHPAVREVAVIGVPDERWGESVCAVVVSAAPVTAEELVAFCRPRLATFEVPKRIDFVDSLPRGATGKVLKRGLRDTYRTAATF
ncbi:MAG: class I adenylate-forming enzyme family protein [Actinoallomurus sp.]